jgi:hypothetical protein
MWPTTPHVAQGLQSVSRRLDRAPNSRKVGAAGLGPSEHQGQGTGSRLEPLGGRFEAIRCRFGVFSSALLRGLRVGGDRFGKASIESFHVFFCGRAFNPF